jgi:hypothetical protein
MYSSCRNLAQKFVLNPRTVHIEFTVNKVAKTNLTSCSKDSLEKLVKAQVVKKLLILYCRVYSRCYGTTERWADIPGSFLDNGSVNTLPLLGSRFLIMQQLDGTIKDLCFLCGPCRDVISKEHRQLRDSSVRESVKNGLEPEEEK